jgi:ribosomal-protein-alanine N-acetyltransferase
MGICADPLVSPDRTAAPCLRAMAERDLGAVAAIEEASATLPWSAATFAHELGIPFSSALVAEIGGRGIVGFAIWWRVAEEIHLLNLAVAPPSRRSGIGRALLRAVLRSGRGAGAERVALEVVLRCAQHEGREALRVASSGNFR